MKTVAELRKDIYDYYRKCYSYIFEQWKWYSYRKFKAKSDDTEFLARLGFIKGTIEYCKWRGKGPNCRLLRNGQIILRECIFSPLASGKLCPDWEDSGKIYPRGH